jgi:hypothetical protein
MTDLMLFVRPCLSQEDKIVENAEDENRVEQIRSVISDFRGFGWDDD